MNESRKNADVKPEGGEASGKMQRICLTVWAIVGCTLVAAAIIYLLGLMSVTVGIVLWSVIIIFCLRTPVNFFERKGMKRVAATAIAYVIMLVVLLAVGILLFSPMFGFGEQFVNLAQNIPDYFSNLMAWANGVYQKYSDVFQNEAIINGFNSVVSSAANGASQLAKGGANALVSFGTGIANTCIAIGFALVVAFWLLIELPGMGREVYRLFPDRFHEDLTMMHLSATRVMGGYIKATLLQCALIGVMCAILFTIVGIADPVALGAITGLLNIIPIVGPWFGAAVGGIAGMLVSTLVAIIALAGTVAIQRFVYTFVSPEIMRNSVDIHPAATLIVMTMGSALGGAMGGLVGSLVGMLLSIPLIAVAKAFFVYYYEKHTGRCIVSEDGVFFRGSPSPDGSFDPLRDATEPRKLEQAKLSFLERVKNIGKKEEDAAAADGSSDGDSSGADGVGKEE